MHFYHVSEACVDVWGPYKVTGRATERTSHDPHVVVTSILPAKTADVATSVTVATRHRLTQQSVTAPPHSQIDSSTMALWQESKQGK